MSDVDFNQPAQGYPDSSRAMDSARPRGRRRKADPPDAEEETFGADGSPDPEAMPRPRGRRHRQGPAVEPESPPSSQHDEANVGVLQELGLASSDPDSDEPAEHETPQRRTQRSGDRKRRTSVAGGGGAPRRRGRRFAPTAALLSLLLIMGAGGGVGYWWLRTYIVPPDFDGSGTGEVEVVVAEGDTGSDIADTLAEADVVASSQAFLNALRGADSSQIGPGTYALRAEMSGSAAVDMLLSPETRVAGDITLQEGLRATQIFEEIAAESPLSVAELEEAAEDPEELGIPDYAEGRLEGYLFPDTYLVDPDANATELLAEMVDRYHDVAADIDLESRAAEADLTPQEVMAIAAIIQAEAGSPEDMPKVAQVVYNRLDIGMELGMDSTCFYVIDDYGIALTSEQLQECDEADSEYATYGREGIPVGPIVSPGVEAIEAALEPEDGDWLYFVTTDPDEGYTQFAETEEEFRQLRDEFNQNRGAQ